MCLLLPLGVGLVGELNDFWCDEGNEVLADKAFAYDDAGGSRFGLAVSVPNMADIDMLLLPGLVLADGAGRLRPLL